MSTPPREDLDPALYRDLVRRALAEDLGWGDVTTQAVVAPDTRARGILFGRRACVLAGLDIAGETFRQLDPGATWTVFRRDGERCQAGERVAQVEGLAAALLTGERTALNFLRHLSGIATATRELADAAAGRMAIADTRKTLPLLRAVEKYAVRVGGAVNGRATLDDGVVIKTNHLRLAGGIRAAVELVHAASPETPVEVEVASMAQVDEALSAGAAILLVSHLSMDEIRETVRRCRGRARLELSGPFALDHLAELTSTGADYVSLGALTDSAAAADISLELEPV